MRIRISFPLTADVMRRIFLTLILAGSAACNASHGTSPDATIIHVRLIDAMQSMSAGRNQVRVTLGDGSVVDARTGTDGIADVRVTGAGTYQVRVVPRAGYISSDALSRTITVPRNATVVVEFVLRREGGTGQPPDPEAR